MIKVLFVITGNIHSDGITLSQLEVIKYINKEKFSIDILEYNNSEKKIVEEFEKCGCNIIKMPNRKRQLFKYRKELKQLIIKNKYDIIHVHGSSSLLCIELGVAKKCGVPVRIAHSRNTTCDHKLIDKLLRKKFYNSYNVALSCGRDAGKWLFDNDDFIVMHNGKDFKRFNFNKDIRKKYREKLNLDNTVAYGHVGSFNEQKNHEFLINSFHEFNQKNKNTKLFLFGDGPNREKIKELVDNLNMNDKVIFCGAVSNVEDYLQAMDIMLFPSKFEGLPNVVLEWQAVGLPCIISNKITNECIISKEVYKVSIENIDNWVNQMNNVIPFDNITRNKVSIENRKKLEEEGFEIISNTKKLEEIYIKSKDWVKTNE